METDYMVATSGDPTFEQLSLVKTMKAFIEALQPGDTTAAKDLLADHVVMMIRGKSLLSGEYRGPDGVLELLSKMDELANGTHKVVGTLALMVHNNHIHTVVAETATRNEQTLRYNRALIFEVSNDKIVMGQAFEDDQYAFDAFWS